MSPPLNCRDLKSGDIMLQHNLGNAAGTAIKIGQALTGHKHTDIIHAGIMFDSTYIIEALDKGIAANDVRTGNRNCSYVVFRARNPQLATVAGNLAKLFFDEHGTGKNLKYDTAGAVGSIGRAKPAKSNAELDKLMDQVFTTKINKMFCSQFVVLTYQISGGQIGIPPQSVFSMGDARMAPARLAMDLDKNSYFQNVGYMAANQR